jgi:hypothetical protein
LTFSVFLVILPYKEKSFRMTAKEMLKILRQDGWIIHRRNGLHSRLELSPAANGIEITGAENGENYLFSGI